MLYAGAVAAGVFSAANGVTLFGSRIGFGAGAFVALALAGTLGYLVGALIGWAIGRYGGRPLLERHGGWFHLSPERLDRAEAWFGRWGALGVLIGRVTPVVRSFVSIAAGVFEMPLVPYTVLTLVGSAIWAFAFAGAGYGLGNELSAASTTASTTSSTRWWRASSCCWRIWCTGRIAAAKVAPRADDSSR